MKSVARIALANIFLLSIFLSASAASRFDPDVEAGHIAQNIRRRCTSLGPGEVPTGALRMPGRAGR